MPGSAYRDALDAAHGRIAELEAHRDERVADRRLAALVAERTRVAAALASPESELVRLLRWKIYVPFSIVAIVFALDRDWLFAALAPVLAVAVRWVGRSFVAANAQNDAKHLEMLDAEIATLSARDRSAP